MRLKVKTETHTYSTYIKNGLLKKIDLPDKSFIITDVNVKKYYGKYFKDYPILSIKPGEKNKRLDTIEQMAEGLVSLGVDRNSTLISLGGGVVGDMTGFLASIYMRGIDVMHIPTSLLAMVDASIGGKTGVDLESGKNLLGRFHQPDAVVIDPEVIDTLPDKEFKNGLAESIKHSIIDKRFFYWLDSKKEKIKSKDKKILEKLIYKNILIKRKIVEHDEKEKNLRAILNLGHTFGHALESLSDYKIFHGEAVAKGIIKAAQLADMKKIEKVKEIFDFFAIDWTWPNSKKFTAEAVLEKMKTDKKNKNSKITLVLPLKIGKVKIFKNFNEEKILEIL